MSDTIYNKLKLIRVKKDIELPRPPNFREFLVKKDGTQIPLKLRPYQQQMVVHLLAMNRFIVGDDTGLGKTIETIASLCHVWKKNPNQKVMVLTKKSSVPQWDSEFAKFTQGVNVFMCVGGKSKREKAQQEFMEADGPCVLIQGYTAACNDFGNIQHWEDYVLVCDEATVFKTPTTRVHKVCRYLSSKANRVWGLTATLIKNTLIEGYGIYSVVVPDLFQMTPQGFINQFAITRLQRVGKGRQVPVVVGYGTYHIEMFRDKIDPYYLGRPKHSVADELPLLTTKSIKVGLTKFQEEKYNEALGGILELGDGDERETTQLTSIIYCQEIVNHPCLIEFPDYSSEKLDALVDLCTEGGDLHNEKVIVFTRFAKMVDKGIEVLEKAKVKCTRVTGSENELQRREAMNTFQDTDSDTKVIWITMAGGDAINLQAAKALVFYDTPWSAGDYLQILGRMIRIGSEHDNVYCIHLVCRDTIDERVQGVIKSKMKLIESVLGERVKGEVAKDQIYTQSNEIRDIFDALAIDARNKKLPKKK